MAVSGKGYALNGIFNSRKKKGLDPLVKRSPNEAGSVVYSDLLFQAAAPSAITGTASFTDGLDTVSASGAITVSGSASFTEGADTVAASGQIVASGSAAFTEGADTANALGTVSSSAITGTASFTEGADTVSASGAISVVGTAAFTEDQDAASASGSVVAAYISGAANILEGDDAVSSVGEVTGGFIDTHDGFWAREYRKMWERKPKKQEIVETIKESPQEFIEAVAQELPEVKKQIVKEYGRIDYKNIANNVNAQIFIANLLINEIELAEIEEEEEILLLM